MPYSGLTPRIGIDTISATHRIRLSTTADPSPTVARAKPASGPATPDSVISRYPSAELAALPPGTMLDSAARAHLDPEQATRRQVLAGARRAPPSSAAHSSTSATISSPSPSTSSHGSTRRSSVERVAEVGRSAGRRSSRGPAKNSSSLSVSRKRRRGSATGVLDDRQLAGRSSGLGLGSLTVSVVMSRHRVGTGQLRPAGGARRLRPGYDSISSPSGGDQRRLGGRDRSCRGARRVSSRSGTTMMYWPS